jgi:hypothetical protein
MSEGEEELDEDVNEDIIEEPHKKRAQIDPTKKPETLKVPTLYDSEDYLKNFSSTNLKNSPKPKAATSKITSQKFVPTNDLEDMKKELEQTMNPKMDTIIQLLAAEPEGLCSKLMY